MWISRDKDNIKEYMSKHQHDENAREIIEYFENIIEWIEKIFPKYRKEMKGLDWGNFYNKYKDKNFDPEEIEEKISEMMKNEEIQNKK